MVDEHSLLAGLRVGFGFESGRLLARRELKLGGVMIDHPAGLAGAGDGDVVCRSVLDSLLAACGMPDLRTLFEDDDPQLKEAESLVLLSQTVTALARQQLRSVLNLSVRILCPAGLNLAEDRQRIESTLAAALAVDPGQVTVGFGTSHEFAAVEHDDVLVAFANCLIVRRTQPAGKQQRRQGEIFAKEPGAPPADDEALPERAKKFEKALASKLPPLPPAPKPREGATLIVYTDGASRGNPGPAASGWVILDETGRLVKEGGSALGEHTNNQAEYLAVKEVLTWIEGNLGREFKLEFRLDSELVVKQLSGDWKIKDPDLRQIALETMNLLGYFLHVNLSHVPRQENQRADALANKALGAK
ncbi:2-C-methyl-D-erythritol 2,4-cyclodiphosphate synthase [bacterium]|nr:2-C-methyl-D-erythritol 2,4-cyclodiphosphate synthase [bacterium]